MVAQTHTRSLRTHQQPLSHLCAVPTLLTLTTHTRTLTGDGRSCHGRGRGKGGEEEEEKGEEERLNNPLQFRLRDNS